MARNKHVELSTLKVGYGFDALANYGRDPENSPEKVEALANELIETAWKNGVRLFVTAELYGNTQELIRKSLDRLKQQGEDTSQAVVATKVGIGWGAEGGCFASSAEEIRQSVNHCLQALGKEHLEHVALHRLDTAVDASTGQPKWHESLATLAALQKEGKVGNIGVSEVTADELGKLQEKAKELGIEGGIHSTESSYSPIQRRPDFNGVRAVADKANVAVIGYNILTRGLLVHPGILEKFGNRDISEQAISNEDLRKELFDVLGAGKEGYFSFMPFFDKENIRESLQQAVTFQQTAKDFGLTSSQLAIIFSLSQGITPIFETLNPKHLASNAEAMQLWERLEQKGSIVTPNGVTMTKDSLAALGNRFAPRPGSGDLNPVRWEGVQVLDENTERLNTPSAEYQRQAILNRYTSSKEHGRVLQTAGNAAHSM